MDYYRNTSLGVFVTTCYCQNQSFLMVMFQHIRKTGKYFFVLFCTFRSKSMKKYEKVFSSFPDAGDWCSCFKFTREDYMVRLRLLYWLFPFTPPPSPTPLTFFDISVRPWCPSKASFFSIWIETTGNLLQHCPSMDFSMVHPPNWGYDARPHVRFRSVCCTFLSIGHYPCVRFLLLKTACFSTPEY